MSGVGVDLPQQPASSQPACLTACPPVEEEEEADREERGPRGGRECVREAGGREEEGGIRGKGEAEKKEGGSRGDEEGEAGRLQRGGEGKGEEKEEGGKGGGKINDEKKIVGKEIVPKEESNKLKNSLEKNNNKNDKEGKQQQKKNRTTNSEWWSYIAVEEATTDDHKRDSDSDLDSYLETRYVLSDGKFYYRSSRGQLSATSEASGSGESDAEQCRQESKDEEGGGGRGRRRGNNEVERTSESSLEEDGRREKTQDSRDTGGHEQQGTTSRGKSRVWGVSQSEADLPASVAACFEDPPLLARLQSRLLTLLGRASRYRVKGSFGRPVMPLEALRRKVAEARRRLLPSHAPPDAPPAPPHPAPPLPPSPSLPIIDPARAPTLQRQGHRLDTEPAGLRTSPWAGDGSEGRGRGGGTLERGGGGGGATTEEEMELLKQYLSLQQLAVSRKHSAQLRRIRDSLVAKVRSRPSSLFQPPIQALTPTPHADNTHTVSLHPDPSLTPTSSRHPKISAPSQQPDPTLTPCMHPDPTLVPSPPPPPRPPVRTLSKDRQELRNFLLDIGFVQYYALLNRHGYDLASAAHMDALDLAGAGITEPLHRMALKYELDQVKQPPPVPEEVPETVEEWLGALGLDEYVEHFHQNGIYCPLAALGLTKRDLHLMGIYMHGHRKKILLALAGLKEALFRRE